MKRILITLSLILIIIVPIEQEAQEPGGGMTYAADFDVDDPSGAPVSGVQVKLGVTTWYGDELDPDYYYDEITGTTNANGYAYLEIYVPAMFLEGLDFMHAQMIDPDYSILSSENTTTQSWQTIWPEFEVVYDLDDLDGNGINDNWEIQLADKFCPTLKLHHAQEWIAPEPVEYIGVSKQDLWFVLYNMQGQQVDDYSIQEQANFSPPISDWHYWVDPNSGPNFSFVDGDPHDYIGTPPGLSYYPYKLRFHFNYAGDIESPTGWISYYESERQQNQYPHTTYAHLFLSDNKPVIQYWFFFPYNDGYNNHEGDWEHINVRLTGQNPSTASIETMDYYFHEKVLTLSSSGYQLIDITHPLVYVGGNCEDVSVGCEPGNTTGGSYPWSGVWIDVNPLNYDERVSGLGPIINYFEINIIIIPNRDRINYSLNPEMSWLNAAIRWGNIEVNSPFSNYIDDLKEIGNNAPPGPAYNDGWNAIGAVGQYKNY